LNGGGVAASHVEIIEIYHDNTIGVSLKNQVFIGWSQHYFSNNLPHVAKHHRERFCGDYRKHKHWSASKSQAPLKLQLFAVE
jgi:hypothetical protein